MKFAIIIPARYSSSRFPGKPLALIGGKEMIVRVARRAANASTALSEDDTLCVAVATDDERIEACAKRNGIACVMTSANHQSGTDRIAEALEKFAPDADVVINVQGDEPFIHPGQIEQLMRMFKNDSSTRIATLARRFDKSKGFEALFDPNLVKVVFASSGRALYFSRSIIPYVRGAEWKQWLDVADFFTHVGIYAYRADTLREITKMQRSSLEIAESLEQLRWLQAGIPISVGVTDYPTVGIDTPADLEAAEQLLLERGDIDIA